MSILDHIGRIGMAARIFYVVLHALRVLARFRIRNCRNHSVVECDTWRRVSQGSLQSSISLSRIHTGKFRWDEIVAAGMITVHNR